MIQILSLTAVVTIVLIFPILWYLSETRWSVKTRRVLGMLAISSSFGIAFIVSSINEISYNAWYGSATKNLIQTIISQLEKGNELKLIEELKNLDQKFLPTYENRARYDILVQEMIEKIRKK
jgi:hypothetical protein